MIAVYTLLSVGIVSLLSLLGALLFFVSDAAVGSLITYSLAVSSGVMLGSVFFDVLPESITLFPDGALGVTLAGFIGFFALEKLLSWHHHTQGDHHGDHDEKPVALLTLLGDGIHNFVDGVVIASGYLVSIPIGISTTIAVVAHEIPHEMSDFLVLLHAGLPKSKALLYNFYSALTAIAGACVVLFFSLRVESLGRYLLPFAAGNFLYIAASDLIPELLKKRRLSISIVQIVLLIFGVIIINIVRIFVK
ncbi:MAG: ZIP family metal transporter [Patescibacteria group bacterium]